jgi:hypothetical protein
MTGNSVISKISLHNREQILNEIAVAMKIKFVRKQLNRLPFGLIVNRQN